MLTPFLLRQHILLKGKRRKKGDMFKAGELPDIDLDSQEVFETSDQEDETALDKNQNQVVSGDGGITTTEEDIPEYDFDFDETRRRFLKSFITNNRFDFSGTIENNGSESGYQVVDVEETTLEKLTRIQRELEELRLEDPSSIEEVDKLDSLAKNMQHNAEKTEQGVFKQEVSFDALNLKFKPNLDFDFELELPKLNNDVYSESRIQQLTDLESALCAIETQIGDFSLLDSSIQFKFNDMVRRVQVMEHPEVSLNLVSDHIEQTLKEINKLELSKKAFGVEKTPIAKSDKIDDLFQILPNLKTYASQTPILVDRLKSLSKLHNEMIEVTDFAKNIDQTLADTVEDFKKWDSSLKTLNDKIDLASTTFEENKNKLDSRMEEIDEQVKRLQKENKRSVH